MRPRIQDNWTFSVDYYAEKFSRRWLKRRDDCFDDAKLLKEAKDNLSPRDWETLLDKLPCSESVVKKHIAIAEDKRLRNPSLYKLLPSKYSTIYEVHTLKEQELKAALKEGQISTRMSRAAFIAWRKEWRAAHGGNSAHTGRKRRTIEVLGMGAFAKILNDNSLSERKAIQLAEDLQRVAKRHGVAVEYNKEEQSQLNQAQAALARELQDRLEKRLAPYGSTVTDGERRLLDDALWQHQELEADRPPVYAADQSHSIQNKAHPYSVLDGWNAKCMLEKMSELGVITTRMPVEGRKELRDAHCLQLAIRYLQTSNTLEKHKHKRALQRIARKRSIGSKAAASCLAQIAPFERIGL
jgi:hypothetical protein